MGSGSLAERIERPLIPSQRADISFPPIPQTGDKHTSGVGRRTNKIKLIHVEALDYEASTNSDLRILEHCLSRMGVSVLI